jgi:hypothetical protein
VTALPTGLRFAFRGFSARLDERRRDLLADPNVVAVVPDGVVELTQTVPTGVARVGGRLSDVAAIDGTDHRVDADVAIVDTGITYHPDLNVAGGYNCSTADRTAWRDRNTMGPTSRAPSRHSTTASVSSGRPRRPGAGGKISTTTGTVSSLVHCGLNDSPSAT